MNNLYLYLLTFGSMILLFVPFLIITLNKNKIKYFENINKWYKRITSFGLIFLFFFTLFHCPGIMKTDGMNSDSAILNPNIGNVFLVGEPYGDNRVANFFAFLSIFLFYPFVLLILLELYFPTKVGALIHKYIIAPIFPIIAFTVFNLNNAIIGLNVFDYRSVLLTLTCGFAGFLLITNIFNNYKTKPSNVKETLYMVAFFLVVTICCAPAYTASVLFDTNAMVLGKTENLLRFYGFTFEHRLALYVTFAFPMFIYFFVRNQDENTRKVMVLSLSIGALIMFMTSYGAYNLFIRDGSNQLKLIVTRLPIHLCHTALYVVPICVIFKFKRLFYFTYFINVFGALMAMIYPNNGELSNIYDPDVVLFWYNHISALIAPLLCVALGVFEKPKMKDMLWSLLFFAIYFLLCLFLNAWLSNYVSGYNPNVLGSGTDYFFLNNDYVIGIFGDEAKKLLNIKFIINVNNLTLVFYPPYQALFLISYTGIAFLMWYIYSFFFMIAKNHKEIYLNNLENKKRKQEYLNTRDQNIDHTKTSIQFIDFSKKYTSNNDFSVKNFNLEVSAGQIFGFIGPNGAGKSTCIKSLVGIQSISEGHIYVNGYNVEFEAKKAKQLIGFVPDHYSLDEKLTGREYINHIADLYNVDAKKRDAAISKYSKDLRIDHALDNRIETYSHGMKQKIALISSIVHEPKIWILDEPLTGLDPQSAKQVKQCMKDYANNGNIVFFSSHIIDVVNNFATNIGIINHGKLISYLENKGTNNLEELFINLINQKEAIV